MSGDPVTPVLVVGAGPVGATAALLLARHGVPCVIVDRKLQPDDHPAAHVLSTRTLEIWRELGLERAIRSDGARLHELRCILYCTTLTGRELGRISLADADELDEIEAYSPTRAVHLPQHRLEALLWRRLETTPSIELRPGVAYDGHRCDVHGASVSLRDVRGGARSTLRARYVIAADGAGSRVRRALNIGVAGPVLQHVMSVHFSGRLDRLVAGRRGPVVWSFSPTTGIGTLIVHRPPDDWVFQIPYFPPFEEPADFTPTICRDRILSAVGTRAMAIQIKSIRPWVMTAQIAERYRGGPIFLAGDAAHRFPPTGGLGLNTGVADVHNLVWKLAWVLDGGAPESLLDSYERERRPIAVQNCAHATENFHKMFDVLAAVGISAKARGKLDRIARSALVRLAPRRLRRAAMGVLQRSTARRLGVLERDGAAGAARRDAVARAIRGQRAHYRFWGLDLGVRYRDGAVLDDTGAAAEPADLERYVASTRAGARLPHAWVHHHGRRCSTLDLLDRDRCTLLISDAGARWAHAAAALGDRADLAVVTLGDSGAPAVWRDRFALAAGAALLVRPDGHIAWRATAMADDPVATLTRVLARLQTIARQRPARRGEPDAAA